MNKAIRLAGYRNQLLRIESLARVASAACRAGDDGAAQLEDVGRAIEALTSDLIDVISDMGTEISGGLKTVGSKD